MWWRVWACAYALKFHLARDERILLLQFITLNNLDDRQGSFEFICIHCYNTSTSCGFLRIFFHCDGCQIESNKGTRSTNDNSLSTSSYVVWFFSFWSTQAIATTVAYWKINNAKNENEIDWSLAAVVCKSNWLWHLIKMSDGISIWWQSKSPFNINALVFSTFIHL